MCIYTYIYIYMYVVTCRRFGTYTYATLRPSLPSGGPAYYLSLPLSLSLYIYIYIYMHVCMWV